MTALDLFIMASRSSIVSIHLKTDLGDKLHGQQPDNTVGGIEYSLPSRWLHRVEKQQLRLKNNSQASKMTRRHRLIANWNACSVNCHWHLCIVGRNNAREFASLVIRLVCGWPVC